MGSLFIFFLKKFIFLDNFCGFELFRMIVLNLMRYKFIVRCYKEDSVL